ncbi:MAG: hypothetical protein R6W94_10565 [Spirochaetia bacterium]
MPKIAVIVLVLTIALTSCRTVGVVIPDGPPSDRPPAGSPGEPDSGPDRGARGWPNVGNNQTLRLERGSYSGGAITSNRVTIVGRGRAATVIRGDLVIRGNSCTVTDLTIDGDVVITGNNADLRGARIRGSVDSRGQNNAW